MSSTQRNTYWDTLNPAILPYLLSADGLRLQFTCLNDPNKPEHLDRGPITGAILSAPEQKVTWMMDGQCKHLYIRAEYERMYEKLMRLLSDPYASVVRRTALVTGAPGVGKSHFLAYMLWRLLNQSPFIDANGRPTTIGAVQRARLPIEWIIYQSRGRYLVIWVQNMPASVTSLNLHLFARFIRKDEFKPTDELFSGSKRFVELMESENVLVLINHQGKDPDQQPLRKYAPITVVASSPSDEGLRRLDFGTKLVCSEWTLEEVQSYCLFSETPIEEPNQIRRYFNAPNTDWSSFIVEHCIWRYCRFGGLPRLIFSSSPNDKIILEESKDLAFLDFGKIDECLDQKEVNHFVLQRFFLYGRDADASGSEEQFSISLRPQLMPLIEHRLARHHLRELLNRMSVIDRRDMSPQLRRHPHIYSTFERAFIELLRSGFRFPIRYLGYGRTNAGFFSSWFKDKWFELPRPVSADGHHSLVPIHMFMSTHMGAQITTDVAATPAGHVCIPENSNFPAIDAFVRPNLLFQVTYAKSHSISAQLQRIVDGLGLTKAKGRNRAPHLYTVVPASIFKSFQHAPSDLAHMPVNVYRFAICIDSAEAIAQLGQLPFPEHPLPVFLPGDLQERKAQVNLLKPILESFAVHGPAVAASLSVAEIGHSLP